MSNAACVIAVVAVMMTTSATTTTRASEVVSRASMYAARDDATGRMRRRSSSKRGRICSSTITSSPNRTTSGASSIGRSAMRAIREPDHHRQGRRLFSAVHDDPRDPATQEVPHLVRRADRTTATRRGRGWDTWNRTTASSWRRPHRVLETPCIQFGASVLDEGPGFMIRSGDTSSRGGRRRTPAGGLPGLKLATSPDGFIWTQMKKPGGADDVILPHNHDINSIFRDPIRKRYIAIASTHVTRPRVERRAAGDDAERERRPARIGRRRGACSCRIRRSSTSRRSFTRWTVSSSAGRC